MNIAAAPITGRKSSGWGSHGGRYGIELFLHLKTVTFATESTAAVHGEKRQHEMS